MNTVTQLLDTGLDPTDRTTTLRRASASTEDGWCFATLAPETNTWDFLKPEDVEQRLRHEPVFKVWVKWP